jgi:hypothetical protein
VPPQFKNSNKKNRKKSYFLSVFITGLKNLSTVTFNGEEMLAMQKGLTYNFVMPLMSMIKDVEEETEIGIILLERKEEDMYRHLARKSTDELCY